MKKILDHFYNRCMHYAGHPLALGVLGLVAFSSSIFFPVPPDPLLLAIALKNPRKIPLLVVICALAASLGGLVMYGIGYSLYEAVGTRILDFYGWQETFARLRSQLHAWGFWLLLIKAFTPIPYKLIALAYGVGQFDPLTFFTASLLGRALRYALEGCVLWFIGPSLHHLLEKYFKQLILLFLLVVVLGFVGLRFL